MRRYNRRPGTFVKNHVNPDDPAVKRACTNKRKYATKKRASSAAHLSERKAGIEIDQYHCRMCGYYHLYRVRDEEGNFIPIARDLVPVVSKLKAIQ